MVHAGCFYQIFTRLGHDCQGLLKLCDGMHVCTREKSPLPEKFSPKEYQTHGTAWRRTASPTHYRRAIPVSQDISEPDEWEPFRFILTLVAEFLGTIPINPDSSGRTFGNDQDLSEPTRRSLAHMNVWLFLNRFWWVPHTVAALMRLCDKSLLTYLFISLFMMHSRTEGPNGFTNILLASFRVKIHWVTIHCTPAREFSHACGEQN